MGLLDFNDRQVGAVAGGGVPAELSAGLREPADLLVQVAAGGVRNSSFSVGLTQRL